MSWQAVSKCQLILAFQILRSFKVSKEKSLTFSLYQNNIISQDFIQKALVFKAILSSYETKTLSTSPARNSNVIWQCSRQTKYLTPPSPTNKLEAQGPLPVNHSAATSLCSRHKWSQKIPDGLRHCDSQQQELFSWHVLPAAPSAHPSKSCLLVESIALFMLRMASSRDVETNGSPSLLTCGTRITQTSL